MLVNESWQHHVFKPKPISLDKPFTLKVWEENVGADASVTNVRLGKRVIDRDKKTVSQVPLPIEGGKSPFVVELPKFNENKNVAVDTDTHLWKSYRSTINADDNRAEGIKVWHKVEPTKKVYGKVRKALRQKLRDHDSKEMELAKAHQTERLQQLHRHSIHADTQKKLLRERARENGFDGLRKPWVKPGPPPPTVDEDEVTRVLNTPGLGFERGCVGGKGKKMVLDHASRVDSGKPFGSMRPESEPLMRWTDKTMF